MAAVRPVIKGKKTEDRSQKSEGKSNRLQISSSVFCLLTSVFLLVTGCQQNSYLLEPTICYDPQPAHISRLASPFPTLSRNELQQDWARELLIGQAFARELDYYRAITALKRALILLPPDANARRSQIVYSIMLCYYLGGKYQDTVETFEHSDLREARPDTFPAFGDLLLILQDAYWQDDRCERSQAVLQFIQQFSPETADDLVLYETVVDGDVCKAYELAECHPKQLSIEPWLDNYVIDAKSVPKAQWLNALLPGAGYYYVGQTKSAITSFLLNTLFTFAAYQFFHRDYIAAGIITAGFEFGWYVGGVNGAGLAAKQYNERLYECQAKEMLIGNQLFPVLMLEFGF